jgi:hypothetical protein
MIYAAKRNVPMNKLFFVLMAAALSALAQPFPLDVANASAPTSRPPRLEGMNYLRARRIVMSYGWVPAAGPCFGVTASECTSFPEIDSCSCCGRAPCAMLFIRRNRCLSILTEVGPPDPAVEDGDTHVVYVSFRGHHCSKSP